MNIELNIDFFLNCLPMEEKINLLNKLKMEFDEKTEKKELTLISDLFKNKKISKRLKNCFDKNYHGAKSEFQICDLFGNPYSELVSNDCILKIRNGGKKTLQEFINLRGF